MSQLKQTETSVFAMGAILNPLGVAAPEEAERAPVETDGSPTNKEAGARPKKARKRRVMQPRAPPFGGLSGLHGDSGILRWGADIQI